MKEVDETSDQIIYTVKKGNTEIDSRLKEITETI